MKFKALFLSVFITFLFYPETYQFLGKMYMEGKLMVKIMATEDVHEGYKGDKIPVVFIFDDGWKNVYDVAYPILSEAGFVGNVSIVPGLVSEYDYMNKHDLAVLYENGWELMNHTYSHHEDMYYKNEELLADFNKAKVWMEKRNLVNGSKAAIIPYGKINASLYTEMLNVGYTSIRTSNHLYRLQDHEIEEIPTTVINLLTSLTPSEVFKEINLKEEKKHPIIFILHKVDDEVNEYEMSYSPEYLKEVVDYLKHNNDQYDVISYSELVNMK